VGFSFGFQAITRLPSPVQGRFFRAKKTRQLAGQISLRMVAIRIRINAGLTLARFEAWVGFVDDINLAAATYDLTVFMPSLGRLQRR
jgi:hypothetical protein